VRIGSVVRAGLGAAAAALAWASLVERNWFTVRDEVVRLLPEGETPLRVLHISDTHLAPWQERKIQWLRSLARLRPDAVVLTGDLLGHRDAQGALLRGLAPLAALDVPMFFVHGSNDYYGPRLKNPLKYLRAPSRKATRKHDINNASLTAGLEKLGAVNLNNSAATATIAGTPTVWFGLNDPHIRYDDAEAMETALNKLNAPKHALRFGVVHAPYQESLNTLLANGADHMFAGHTHGGQVCLPGVGALTSNCDLPNRQASGVSAWYDAHRAATLSVSAGLGTSIYAPVRFFCRPEAPLLTFETLA
jgi:predicted MPP superfamily phosphohydrolase